MWALLDELSGIVKRVEASNDPVFGTAGTRGISLFLIPKFLVNADGSLGPLNDIYASGVEHKLGMHASPTCTMTMGDHGGAIGYLIGEENRGMQCMFTMMNQARLGVGLEGVGIADRAYQQALAFAQERRQGRAVGKTNGDSDPIIVHPDVKRMLMQMRALTAAARTICYATAVALDRAKRATVEGRPYLLDIHTRRDGIGAASTWHPSYSIADLRTRKV